MWHRNQNRDRSTHTQTHNKPELQQTLHPATQTGSKRESEAGWQGRGLNLCLVLLMSRITHRQAEAGTAAKGGTHTHTHTPAAEWPPKGVTIVTHTHTHTLVSLSWAWLWQVGKDLCDWQRNSQKMQTIPWSWPGAGTAAAQPLTSCGFCISKLQKTSHTHTHTLLAELLPAAAHKKRLR